MKQKLRPLAERPFAQDFSGDGKTQQHFTEGCDVNNIIAQYAQTGVDVHADRATNQRFGYATSTSYLEAMQNIAEINSAFAELPSKDRSQFDNDPAQWVESLEEPETIDEVDDPPAAPEPPQEPPEAPPSPPNEGETDST